MSQESICPALPGRRFRLILLAGVLLLSGCIKQRHAIVDPPPPQPDVTLGPGR